MRVRNARPAQQLGPAVGQCPGVCRAGARQLARAQLGRQAARVAQAPGVAARRRGAALSQAGLRHRPDAALQPRHGARHALVRLRAVCAAAGGCFGVFVARRQCPAGTQHRMVCRPAGHAMGPGCRGAGPHQHAAGPDDRSGCTGDRHQCRGLDRVAPGVQAPDDGDCYNISSCLRFIHKR